MSADLLTPAPTWRPKGSKTQDFRAPVAHQEWCAVSDRLRQQMCPDLGCEGPTRKTALGDVHLVTGVNEFADITLTPNGTPVLHPDEALDVAAVLLDEANTALGGETHRPAFGHILRGLDLPDVIALAREALAVIRADVRDQPRPRGTKYQGPAKDAGEASLGPILAVFAVLSAVIGAVTMILGRAPGFAAMCAAPVLLLAAIAGANVYLPKVTLPRRRRALKASEVAR